MEKVNYRLMLQIEILWWHQSCYSIFLFNFPCAYFPLSLSACWKITANYWDHFFFYLHFFLIAFLFFNFSCNKVVARLPPLVSQLLSPFSCKPYWINVCSTRQYHLISYSWAFFPSPTNCEGYYKVCENKTPLSGRWNFTAL